jgi:hypothetical protein
MEIGSQLFLSPKTSNLSKKILGEKLPNILGMIQQTTNPPPEEK